MLAWTFFCPEAHASGSGAPNLESRRSLIYLELIRMYQRRSIMLNESTDINKLTREPSVDPDFPHAPADWTREDALAAAREEGLELTDDHWETVRALQSYYASHDEETVMNLRALHDALDEHFHLHGGLKYLYTLFPGGPIAQGCRLAGLEAPFIAADNSFGSVA
jgi:TusE/DsrC/DsvC family sulfur relay protein